MFEWSVGACVCMCAYIRRYLLYFLVLHKKKMTQRHYLTCNSKICSLFLTVFFHRGYKASR